MNWLFVTAEFPWPIAHGTWLRVYHLARTLRREGQSVAILAPPAADPGGPKAYADVGVTVLAPIATNSSDGGPGLHPFDPALAEAVGRYAGDFDAVVLTGARTLHYASCAAGAKCVVADLVDDLTLETRRKMLTEGLSLQWLRRRLFIFGQRRYESRHLRHVRLATFVSEVDAAAFSARHADANAKVVPNGVDAAWFDRPDDAAGAQTPTALFLGNLLHPPNADAARYLLEQIAPRVRRRLPEARFVVLGASPTADLHDLAAPGDRITGWVDDIRPTLWAADAVVLPMRMGTGIKNKLLEAWAAGRAVAATPLACQGTPAVDGANVLCAQTADDLADATARLLTDAELRRRLGEAGRKTVCEHFSWSAAAASLTGCVAGAMAD